MDRALTWIVSSYFGLAVVHWWSVARLLHDPPGGLWCGNVITDPWCFLMNKLGPLAAVCVAIRLSGRIQGRRRPLLPIWVVPLLLGTTAGLVLEAWLLSDYGLPLSHTVWWFPWL
jgi:hypothetical protein